MEDIKETKYVIARYQDDGYGGVHLIEQFHTNDDALVKNAIDNWEGDDPDYSSTLESFHGCDHKMINWGEDFNPDGAGNDIDELRIHENDELIYTIG
ncbi:hypothetical protein OAE48_02860 [Flavobacteriales bacterium]|nr:hypothetical protein [Flavobacteriales bacterium]